MISVIRRILDQWSSILFAVIIILVPWEDIRGAAYPDLQNYSYRIDQIQMYGEKSIVFDDSIIGWLSVEIIWIKILQYSINLGISAEQFFKIISAVSAFSFHRFLKTYLGWALSGIFLLNPITIDLLLSQIRIALAFSIFLIFLDKNAGKLVTIARYIALIIVSFIHTAMAIFVISYLQSSIITKIEKYKHRIKILLTLIFVCVVFFIFFSQTNQFLGSIDDRRADIISETKSFQYIVFWLVWCGLLISSASNENASRWEYHFAIAICLLGSLLNIAGYPGFRFIASGTPIIFATFTLFSHNAKRLMSLVIPVYWLALFSYWVS
jgi:hypothetical protein